MDKPIDDAAFWEMVSLLDEAERLIDTKDFEPALENSEQVIDDVEELIVVDAQPPGHLWRVLAEAQNVRGVVLDALGQTEQARTAYQIALKADPGHKDARLNLRELESELREARIAELLTRVNKPLEKMRDSLKTAYEMVDSKQLAEALTILDEAFAIGKPLLALLGKQAPAALRDLLLSLVDERAYILEELARFEEAAEAYRALLQLKPGDREARIAVREIEQGLLEPLIEGYGEAFRRAHSSFQQALDLDKDKDYEEALAACRSALEVAVPWLDQLGDRSPLELIILMSDAHNLEGALLIDLGREQEAIGSFEAALILEPNFRIARVNLRGLSKKIQASQRAGAWDQYDGAIDALEQRLAEARRRIDSAEHKEALKAVEELVDRANPIHTTLRTASPRDLRLLLSESQYLRGVLLDEMGRSWEALAAYWAALKVDPWMDVALNRVLELEEELGVAHGFEVMKWFHWHYQGHIDRGVLEANGVTAFLPDDAMTRWLFPLTIGGGRAVVARQDAVEANDILAADPLTDEALEQIEREAGVLPRCPHCESWQVGYEAVHLRLAFFMWWLTKIPITFRKGRYVCRCCGHEWIDLSEGLT